jgi:hypothetical protein
VSCHAVYGSAGQSSLSAAISNPCGQWSVHRTRQGIIRAASSAQVDGWRGIGPSGYTDYPTLT